MTESVPAPDESIRCSTLSRRLKIDPGGTALEVDEIIVVDVALPWPKPVWGKQPFDQVPAWVASAAATGRKVRVMAAVPDHDPRSRSRLVVHSRSGNSGLFVAVSHQTAVGSLPDLVRRLLVDGLHASPETVSGDPAQSTELLVCTQGSHDICCGTRGTTFVAEIGSLSRGLSVRRVSHMGGHRFAPTVLTLPDGRMWGLLEAEQMLGIVERSLAPSAVAGFCRGWTGAEQGPAQMAERAVFASVDDWAWDHGDRSVEVVDSVDGVTTCLVTSGASSWRVEIEAGRELQVITCGAPGGLPAKSAKPATEFVVRNLISVD